MAGAGSIISSSLPARSGKKPNIVFILADDLGYGDLSCFGAKDIKTPHIDSIRKNGVKFTDFQVHSRCSPTRFSFLTGCYAARVGCTKVLYLHDYAGLHPDELTIPELLKQKGYRTGMVGKWHVGEGPPFFPKKHGFDFSTFRYDAPDMKKAEKEKKRSKKKKKVPTKSVLQKNDGTEIKTRKTIHTEIYTQEAQKFIKENRDDPFFLYFAHVVPHTPMRPGEGFKGKSSRSDYGDVVQEMDWSVGQVMKTLKENSLDKNTLVIFTSDNGPQLSSKQDSAGKAGPLRDGKWSQFDGGTRTPFVAQWPGKIKPGSQCDELVGIIDMLPTFCFLSGAALPKNRIIDGKNITPCLLGERVDKPVHETFAYMGGKNLIAYRYKEWKLFLKKGKAGGKNAEEEGRKSVEAGALFNLKDDIGETKELQEKYPEVAERITKMAKKFYTEFEKNRRPLAEYKK